MYEFLDYQVADAMTYRPLTVSPGTPLAEVEALFERHDFNSLPVVSRDGILLGVVTKLDFLKAFAFTPQEMVPHYDEIMRRPVESVMTGNPVTIPPHMVLTRLLQLMVDARYRSVPVTIGDRNRSSLWTNPRLRGDRPLHRAGGAHHLGPDSAVGYQRSAGAAACHARRFRSSTDTL